MSTHTSFISRLARKIGRATAPALVATLVMGAVLPTMHLHDSPAQAAAIPLAAARNTSAGNNLQSRRLIATERTAPSTTAPSTTTTPPLFGIMQNDGTHLADEWTRGIRIKWFEVGWDAFEPAQGVINQDYVTTKKRELSALYNAGFKVVLEMDVHFPPQWVFGLSPNTRYKNQYGDVYAPPQGSGFQIANGVFDPAVRQAQAWYYANLFSTFGTSFWAVRAGGSYYGELHYPPQSYNGHTNAYWAFDGAAQAQSPLPGWKPGTRSANHADATKFANWYLNALVDYQNWQISTIRASFPGQIAMLYPGWGVRTGEFENAVATDLNGSSIGAGNVADGVAWKRQIAALKDPNVSIYCTWLDSSTTYSNDTDPTASLNKDNSWSPMHLLSAWAQYYHRPAWGENAGSGKLSDMQLAAQRVQSFHLQAMMWMCEPQLYSGPYATIGNYQTVIQTTLAAY